MNEPTDSIPASEMLDANVVFLVNFVAPNAIAVLNNASRRVSRFTVLSSVDVESNRDWKPDWGELDVVVQKTITRKRVDEHPSGYRDVGFTHIPIDTLPRLASINPDVVISLELGSRTLFAMLYCLVRRKRHVVAVLASERSEAGRSKLRQSLRRFILSRASIVTTNGPSCTRYLLSLGANESALRPWDYAADPRKPYTGPIEQPKSTRRLLTVGQLSERKGAIVGALALSTWADANPEHDLVWDVVGTGPLEQEIRSLDLPPNLQIDLHGHRDPDELRVLYRDCDALFFPTLGDEWGLVNDEALASGLPVLGSIHSQSVETLIEPGRNGFTFDPDDHDHRSIHSALTAWAASTASELQAMSRAARASALPRSAEASAAQLVAACRSAIEL